MTPTKGSNTSAVSAARPARTIPRPVRRGSRRARFVVKGAAAGPSGSSLGDHSRSVATKCAALRPSRVLNFPGPDLFRSFVNPRHGIWPRRVAGITGGGARRHWWLKDSVLPGKNGSPRCDVGWRFGRHFDMAAAPSASCLGLSSVTGLGAKGAPEPGSPPQTCPDPCSRPA